MLCPLIERLPLYPVYAYIMVFIMHQVAFDLLIRIALVYVDLRGGRDCGCGVTGVAAGEDLALD